MKNVIQSLINPSLKCRESFSLLKVEKPSRYIGGEWNSQKTDPDKCDVWYGLCYPDIYEIGMSYFGHSILYHLLANTPSLLVERVYAPWPDMAQMLTQIDKPLFSLENKIPVSQFDILGFSLQHELCYPTVLWMLSLAKIPLRSQERNLDFPLIIGGGPNAFNPEPIADFFDLFVLGDGEEVVQEIIQVYRDFRGNRNSRRQVSVDQKTKQELLNQLEEIKGIYIPSHPQFLGGNCWQPSGPFYQLQLPAIEKRVTCNLEESFHPKAPIIPLHQVVHDRATIEIQRGCSRGCRFCQAGMLTRPVRRRSPAKILELAEEILQNTGFQELGLLSLSAGDYPYILSLLQNLLPICSPFRTAISLPSLRPETLTPGMIDYVKKIRKTGFTLAPEAGSDRLRRIINKGNTQEDLLATVEKVFQAGWPMIKLYFMLGLPGENIGDIESIADLAFKVASMRKKGKKKSLHLSLSTFIPKSHTPFQWCSMTELEDLEKKIEVLEKKIGGYRKIDLSISDKGKSFLEGILSRGDRRLGPWIEKVFQAGAVLQNWGEKFKYQVWKNSYQHLQEQGQLPHASFYLHRPREKEEIFPWDHLKCGVKRSFLWQEYEQAQQEKLTPDCSLTVNIQSGKKLQCHQCGACQKAVKPELIIDKNNSQPQDITSNLQKTVPDVDPKINSSEEPQFFSYLVKYQKKGDAKYISHLNSMNALMRGLVRLNLPLRFTIGFHPKIKINFSPALALGVESLAEFFIIHLTTPISIEQKEALESFEPINGLRCLEIMEKPNCKSNISLLFEKVIYTLVCPADLTGSIEPLKFISQLEAQLAELTRPEKPNYPWDAIDSFKTSFIKEKIILKLIIIPQANLPGPWKMAKKIFSFSDIDIDYLTIIKDVVMKP